MTLRKQPATLLFAELRGVAKLSEELAPDVLLELIDSYLEIMSDCVTTFGGTLAPVPGGGVLAMFGAPVAHQDHALRALVCAAVMQHRHALWQADNRRDDTAAPELAIGIATGAVLAGNLAAAPRQHDSVLGEPAELGARLRDEATGGQILITPEVHLAARSRLGSWQGPIEVPHMRFESLGAHRFKHVETPVKVLAVVLTR